MDSSAAHRSLKAASRIFILAAIAMPVSGLPQTSFQRVVSDGQRQLIARIEEEQSQDGINSPALIGPLATLGLHYQERGEHAQAIAAIERARQIVRINHGLYSLEEAPLILLLIRSEETRGNVEGAWELEQRLATLTRRHPDDLRTAPILRDLGERRMDVLRRYVAGEFPAQIVLGCYYRGPWGESNQGQGCRAGSRGLVIGSLLSEAQFYYSRAINVILRNEGYSNQELPELLTELARSSLEHGMYGLGRRSLRLIFSHRVANSESELAQLNALVQIADWDLLFARTRGANESVLETYEQTYERLASRGVEQAWIDQVFSPRIPVVLPAFLPNPLVSEETSDSSGFIDVAFDITRHGKSERIEVLDTTSNATDAAKNRLVNLIGRSQFRPRSSDGRFEDRSRVIVRYYLHE